MALPDFEEPGKLECLRELTRHGTILCPGCRERLWLRAGEQRSAHFAHRVLADCPQSRVSLAILHARRLIYRFFQDRIERGKLAGPIELEPAVPALPDGLALDLILHREEKPAIAVVLLETSMKPDLRSALKRSVEAAGFILRPVFLSSSLKAKDGAGNAFLLSTTQRECMHKSPFGLEDDAWGFGSSLHFLDSAEGCWISLRGLHLTHRPHGFSAHSTRRSSMAELLWSESGAEWTHPGEPRAKRPALSRAGTALQLSEGESSVDDSASLPRSYEPPAWLSGGLLCIGCLARTNDWQNGSPGTDRCVCKTCFANGVRLDSL